MSTVHGNRLYCTILVSLFLIGGLGFNRKLLPILRFSSPHSLSFGLNLLQVLRVFSRDFNILTL